MKSPMPVAPELWLSPPEPPGLALDAEVLFVQLAAMLQDSLGLTRDNVGRAVNQTAPFRTSLFLF